MTATTAERTPRQGTRGARWRRDVEGLRALAVGLVLAYHAGLGPPGGFVGVDVFFVVSGFVITTQIVREVEQTGRLRIAAFYARRARRLLPAAGLVLAATAGATWWLAPLTQRGVFGSDIAAAAGYVVNWLFAKRSVDYLAEDLEPSPVLHFWSLSVEEQFYLVWPTAVVVLIWLLTRSRRPVSRRALGVGLTAGIIVPSLAFSILYTAVEPGRAFFVTPTRLWEMGIGALVALGARRWARLAPSAAVALGWLGLLALAASALLVDASTPWPGSAALAPTLATAAVIVAGFAAGRHGPERLLGRPTMVWVGGLSYSLYLWHWPVLRVADWSGVETDIGGGSLVAGSAAIGVSVVLAWLSYRFVEHPIRTSEALRSRVRGSLVMGAVISVLAASIGVLMYVASEADAARRGHRTVAALPGQTLEVPAALTAAHPPVLYDRLTPTPLGATRDLDPVYARGCQTETTSDEVVECVVGDPGGMLEVAVVGDSKMGQWASIVGRIGERRGWRVAVYTKSGCPAVEATVPIDGEPYRTCQVWGERVLDRLTGATAPDVVVTTSAQSTAFAPDGRTSRAEYTAALTRTWERVVAAGAVVVAVSDTPSPDRDVLPVYECVAQHEADPDACTWPARTSPGSRVLRAATEATAGATYADLDPWVCPGGLCRGQYRNVLTYRQGSHITATFAATLEAPLEAALDAAVDGARRER
ncbi:acyltransferase family protein [uncultured Phycicoccus sp.]|uniref:acyltransferase family protein n=1 Tax=uncultured Phycicoccus sp. TaxID=661422 RepID=UPI002638163E|nr:acyltransferase family protein [uncultured Phycicoccus sp.]